MSCFDQVKFISEDAMETASLFIQKVGGVTFTASHVTVSDVEKCRGEDIN